MKRNLLVLILLVGSFGCHLRNPDGSINWIELVTDAKFGIAPACSAQVINKQDCDIILPSLDALIASLNKDITNAAPNIKAALIAIEVKAPNSKPYLDWLIALT